MAITTLTIPTWSFSALSVYESCPYHSRLTRLDKIPELPRPTPVKGKEHANARGNRVHDNLELFVRGEARLDPDASFFKPQLEHMRTFYKDGNVELEQMWCYDKAWQPCGDKEYDKIWLRIKLDSLVWLDDETAVVIDYKTGKRYGNEIKHASQCQLYQLGAFIRYPQLQKLYVELWYLDQKEISLMTFTRTQGMKFLRGFNTRALRMTTDEDFPTKPNQWSCRFCPYGPEEHSNKWVNKSGHCLDGVC